MDSLCKNHDLNLEAKIIISKLVLENIQALTFSILLLWNPAS